MATPRTAPTSPSTPLPDAEIDDLCHRNWVESAREYARWSGRAGVIAEDDGVLLAATGSTFPALLNTAVRLAASVPAVDVVTRADAWFADRGRGYTLFTRDGVAIDDDLRAAATEGGLLEILHPPAMARFEPVEDRALVEGATIDPVGTAADIADFVAVSEDAYGTVGLPPGELPLALTDPEAFLAPHIRAVLGRRDGQAVAAALVILSHGIGGIYWVGTRDAARRSGLGDGVTRAVTNWAFDQGARFVTLQASEQGQPIYARMGYEIRYGYTGWVRFPT